MSKPRGRLGSLLKETVKGILPDGILKHLHAADHYINGERELRLLRRVCPPGRTAIDVGANIGTYTYFLQRFTARVHAYEPNPELAGRLLKLFPDVNVRNAAVSDAASTLLLTVPVRNGRVNHERGSVAQDFSDSENVLTYEVPAVTLDSEDLEDVGFLKIDAEQHEMAVLRGAMRTITRCRPVVLCEVTPLLYPRPLPEMFHALTSAGYKGWFHFAGSYHPFDDFDQERHANRALWKKSFMGGNVFLFPLEIHNTDALLNRR
ncbi:MAG: FkbM family methyltransferase [Gammaproteobacteria bacterium]